MMILVEWTDSGMHLSEGWETVEKLVSRYRKHGSVVTTVGMLVHEDDEVLVVGLSHDLGNDTYFGAQVIHRAAIRRTQELGPAFWETEKGDQGE